ncbi:MAG: hypothetical protein KDC95_06185 [Planctomycetes bacterium]|nr:hypothetical protein [Planctomycetota bacterium]
MRAALFSLIVLACLVGWATLGGGSAAPTLLPGSIEETEAGLEAEYAEIFGEEPEPLPLQRDLRERTVSRALRPEAFENDAPKAVHPDSERAYYAAFAEVLQRDEAEFRRIAEQTLSESTSVAQRVAAIRVWHDAPVEPRYRLVETALSMPELDERVRDFALRFASERARRGPDARAALAHFLDRALARGSQIEARYRAEASFALLRWGDAAEIRGRDIYLFAENDPGVVARAATALAASDVPDARFVLDRLERTHPTRQVREAVARARRDAANQESEDR